MQTVLPLWPTARFAKRLGASLLCASSLFAAADYARGSVPHHPHTRASRPAMTARVALFEQDDLARAARFAQAEIAKGPRYVEPWFLAMEAAHLADDRATALKSAVTICRIAKSSDPRALIAAMRLADASESGAAFRQRSTEVEALAAGDSICGASAMQAMYRASLQGLPNTDVRALAAAAGWLTRWTVTRATAGSAPERFEFSDARIRVPDYLPRNANYVADAEYVATDAGLFAVTGELNAAQITVDDQEIHGTVALERGVHRVRVKFRPANTVPRIRIAKALDFEHRDVVALRLPPRESAYIEAAALLAAGDSAAAATKLEDADLGKMRVGQQLLVSHKEESGADPLEHARWLAGNNRHLEAVDELTEVVREWPLDREARRLLISELQRLGNDTAADRAAAEFLAIAPNARNYRRMALHATRSEALIPEPPFYAAYRRPAPAPLAAATAPVVILLQDKVAVTRRDGSVSLYMHRVVQLGTAEGVQSFQPLPVPEGAQLLTSRIVNGEVSLESGAKPGDEIEEEYVVNYVGDGGMAAHPEAFQYVFNDFAAPLLDARFVVLSPAIENPGYVIASGDVPDSRIEFRDGMRAQVWEKGSTSAQSFLADPPIIRVVENENGWSVPPSVERKRNLLTIHPGPHNREA